MRPRVQYVLENNADENSGGEGNHGGKEGREDDVDLGSEAQDDQKRVLGDAQEDSLIGVSRWSTYDPVIRKNLALTRMMSTRRPTMTVMSTWTKATLMSILAMRAMATLMAAMMAATGAWGSFSVG